MRGEGKIPPPSSRAATLTSKGRRTPPLKALQSFFWLVFFFWRGQGLFRLRQAPRERAPQRGGCSPPFVLFSERGVVGLHPTPLPWGSRSPPLNATGALIH